MSKSISGELEEIQHKFTNDVANAFGDWHNGKRDYTQLQTSIEHAEAEDSLLILSLIERERVAARIDELNRFVADLNSQDPFIPLEGTPQQYVEGKYYDRLAQLKDKS